MHIVLWVLFIIVLVVAAILGFALYKLNKLLFGTKDRDWPK